MSSIFSLALSALSQARDSSSLCRQQDALSSSAPSEHPSRPETPQAIEKRYEKRRQIEEKKENERSKEINRFQKDLDDETVIIDMKLRQILAIQTEDLAKQFGLERQNVDENASRNMKALADRQMREHAILSLKDLTTRFTSKKVFEELVGTSTWLDGQHHNHIKNFEKLGIAVSEIDGFRPEDEKKNKDLAELLESAEALMEENSGENVMGSAAKIKLLSEKFKEAQLTWKKESIVKIEKLEKEMIEKANTLRQDIRKTEDKLSTVRKDGSDLDKRLSGTKEGKMREGIQSQVKNIERRYERHIDRQQQQIDEIGSQINSQILANEAMERSVQMNKMNLKIASSANHKKKAKSPKKSDSPVTDDQNESNFEMEELLSRMEEDVKKLTSFDAQSAEQLKNLKGLSDDCKDEVNSLQNRAKEIKMETDTAINRQRSKVRSLQNELKTATQKKSQMMEESERVHDRVMALSIAQSRRQQKTNTEENLNLNNDDGKNFLMKAKLASTDVSQITADRVLQKVKDNQFTPGHTRLWPNPNSNAKQDLIHFVENDGIDDDDDDMVDDLARGDDINYQPSSISHICEAAYRNFALPLLPKTGKSKGKNKGKAKKGKDASSLSSPSHSYKEAVSVCVAIITGLLDVKHLDKTLLKAKINELNGLAREIPIMKADDAENMIYNDFCIPLITHITTHHINNIVAENKMYTIRLILVSAFALLGVIFLCLPRLLSSITFELTPHPGFIKHMEEISVSAMKQILTGTIRKKPNQGDRPTSRSSKAKKTKSGSEKQQKIVEIDDPLHPRTIYRTIEGTTHQRKHNFKKIGLLHQIDAVRQWVGDCTTRESCQTAHKDWSSTSSNGVPCKGKVIYSEDRFGLCAYQILIYELSSFGLLSPHDIKYKKVSSSSLNNLKECLDNIKRQSSTYSAEFGNIESLLKNIVPCSVPIVMALEFLRKIIDEEIAKQSIFSAIESGAYEDLQYLKSSRTSSAASSRVSTAAREDAFLKSLPERERRYLLDMKMTINLAVDDVLEALEIQGEDGDDYHTVKISEFLKKHITKHMYLLDDLVFQPFSKEALPKVKSEIYKFQKHVEALKNARAKTLDVGGEYTKPLRNKLLLLNNQLAAYLEVFYAKCYENKISEAEIIEMQLETSELYSANRSIVHGSFTQYPDELERIMCLISKDTDSYRERQERREQLEEECSSLAEKVKSFKKNYRDISSKLNDVGSKLSYTSDEASVQGAHIILALLSDLLNYFESNNSASCTNNERLNIADLVVKQRAKAVSREVDSEKILRHILGYFDEEDFSVLGAVFLDEAISRSMSESFEELATEERLKQSTMSSIRQSLKGSRNDDTASATARDVQLQREFQGTQIDEFNFTEERESRFRKGSGLDPRKISNKKERRMSTVQMESFVNEKSLPTVLKTSDALPKSRESSSRRTSVMAGGFDYSNPSSRPTSKSRRPSSQTPRLSMEETENFEAYSKRLMDQFIKNPPSQDENDYVAPDSKLPEFDDSESDSLCTFSVNTLTAPTKASSNSHEGKVPLVNKPKTTSRKATLALLPGGDGKVSSYVAD